MKLRIQTPEKVILEQEIDGIHMATEAGELSIKDGHAPLFGVINFTHAEITAGDNINTYILRRGTVHMDSMKNKLDIIVAYAAPLTEQEHVTAKEYLDFIKEELKKGTSLSKFQLKYLEEEKFTLEKAVGEE